MVEACANPYEYEHIASMYLGASEYNFIAIELLLRIGINPIDSVARLNSLFSVGSTQTITLVFPHLDPLLLEDMRPYLQSLTSRTTSAALSYVLSRVPPLTPEEVEAALRIAIVSDRCHMIKPLLDSTTVSSEVLARSLCVKTRVSEC